MNRPEGANPLATRRERDPARPGFGLRGKIVVGLRAILRWFDTAIDDGAPPRTGVDWVRCIPFVLVHLTCLFVFSVGVSAFAVSVALTLYAVRMFSITAFYHRYFSHRAFKTSRAAQFVFALFGATAVQRGPLWWAAHHRLHHRHSDQPEDAHSPLQSGFWWSHLGWFMSREYFETRVEVVPDLAKYRELRFIDRYDILMPFLLALSLLTAGNLLETYAPSLGTTGPQLLVWGFFVSTVLLYHATFTINSLCHIVGTRRFDTSDGSRNNLTLALLTFGEGWHNNHHHYPNSARQGLRWWEVDITWYGLLALSRLGVIWDLRVPPRSDHVR